MKIPCNFSRKNARISLLALTLVATLAAIARAVVVPPPEKNDVATYAYDFPDNVPLTSWELIKAESLEPEEILQKPGYIYHYRNSSGDSIEIEVRSERYIGNISRFFRKYTPVQDATQRLSAKREAEIGYYGLLQHEDRVYLSACLNPVGQSTISQQQFTKNRYQNGWSPERGFFWLIGQEDLFDGRCFWTAISKSVPADADSTTVATAYETLESAWFDWYRWWREQQL